MSLATFRAARRASYFFCGSRKLFVDETTCSSRGASLWKVCKKAAWRPALTRSGIADVDPQPERTTS
eukprot:scaffold136871_cov63-Phaeocystis_antarctica.AAC.2